jgi:signal transduction histidine kinase
VTRRRQQREVEKWIAWVRIAAVVFAALEVGVFSSGYPSGYEAAAWATTGALAVGAAGLWFLSHRAYTPAVGLIALAFDSMVIAAFATIYSFEYGSPTRWALIFAVIEAALRYALVGGVVLPLAIFPYLVFVEWWRAHKFAGPSFYWDRVTFPFGVFLLSGLIVGWLVARLAREAAVAEARAAEAEHLRDQLGRRVDVLEAANRCARALASSLEVDEAFGAFIRELRLVIPFERVSIVLVEGDRAEVMAAAGQGTDTVFPPRSSRPVAGSILEEVLTGHTVHRESLRPVRYPEEDELLGLGLETRVLAPLQVGPKAIGALAVMRREAGSFTAEDVELVSLLGRLVATAVQNIRAYEAEHATVEELRRLSALRADFVSVVSHELRSPMAAVIGAARTLQGRWRKMSAGQRESFLALISDETSRLASLIVDVLDTSRIEAGTFSYAFSDVDIAAVVRDVVAAAAAGQDEVRLRTEVNGTLPHVRGDRERLRQVVRNVVDNAVKYSPASGEVVVAAHASNGAIHIDVRDEGPGIPAEDQRLIFEKFGRSAAGTAKPGTGLGLFIARSIVEAHGGILDVVSAPEQGATFSVELPVEGSGSDA